MAEETLAKASEAAPAAGVVVTEAALAEKTAVAEPTSQTTPEAEEDPKKPAEEAPPATEKPSGEEEPATAVDTAIPESSSFKEESNVVADLEDPEKKALDELKQLIHAALANNEFTPPPPPPPPPAAPEEPTKVEEPPVAAAAEEVAAAPAEEPAAPSKIEEVEPPKPETAEEPAAPSTVEEIEPPKPEVAVETAPPAKEEEVVPAAETSVPPAAEEKAVVVDEDGAKTVEAIEETVVPVASPPPAEEVTPAEADVEAPAPTPAAPLEELFIWGVPLVGDEKTDTVLLKFLRARDFKVKDALTMIKDAVIWRKQFGIDSLLEEDLGVPPELEKVVFMHGSDKEGHPVCYNVYGEFQDKELYAKAFGDGEKRQKFLKWRIQFLEKGIRQHLDFSPDGINTMVQVTDLKSVAGPGKRELRQATKQALALLQDNYPEFVAKQVFINVPWWYLAYNQVISSVFTPRSKSKFVFSGPSRSAETLFKYIAPEQVPVQYGGLSKDNDPDFTTADAVTEVTIKPSSKHTIEIPSTETGLLVWEFRVLGWEVSYGAEFVPSAEDGYTVIVAKARKFVATDEPVVKNSFKIGEPGKVVLTIDNATSKKKKLLYRSKVKSATEST